MSPDEDEGQSKAAVQDPPDEGEKGTETDDSGAGAEQEGAQAGESGAAPEQDETEEEDDLPSLLAELAQENPELKQQLAEKLELGERPDPSAQVSQHRAQHLQKALPVINRWQQLNDSVTDRLGKLADELASTAQKGAQDIVRGHRKEDDTDVLSRDDVIKSAATLLLEYNDAEYDRTLATADLMFTDALEQAAGTLLSADDRKKLAEIDITGVEDDKLADAVASKVRLFVAAAARAAPETVAAEIEQKLKKELGYAEKVGRVRAALGRRKRTTTTNGATPRSDGRPTYQEYAAASREQREKWREEGIEPVAPSHQSV